MASAADGAYMAEPVSRDFVVEGLRLVVIVCSLVAFSVSERFCKKWRYNLKRKLTLYLAVVHRISEQLRVVVCPRSKSILCKGVIIALLPHYLQTTFALQFSCLVGVVLWLWSMVMFGIGISISTLQVEWVSETTFGRLNRIGDVRGINSYSHSRVCQN